MTSGSASASNSAAASSSPVAKPQEATPTSPAKNIPEPVMPAAAKKNTAEGLEAFTRYWFDVANYSQKTSDTKQMMDLCVEDSEFCEARKKLADQFRERDAWPVGGEATIGKFYTQMKVNRSGYTNAILEIRESGRKIYDSDGLISSGTLKPSKAGLHSYSVWENGKWKFVGLAKVESFEPSS
ncbi:DUF6318 family protein [Neomicrococcus aestuarii]|nr:DUF6318 family protein [Neomicrococcus aestuarii]